MVWGLKFQVIGDFCKQGRIISSASFHERYLKFDSAEGPGLTKELGVLILMVYIPIYCLPSHVRTRYAYILLFLLLIKKSYQ